VRIVRLPPLRLRDPERDVRPLRLVPELLGPRGECACDGGHDRAERSIGFPLDLTLCPVGLGARDDLRLDLLRSPRLAAIAEDPPEHVPKEELRVAPEPDDEAVSPPHEPVWTSQRGGWPGPEPERSAPPAAVDERDVHPAANEGRRPPPPAGLSDRVLRLVA